MSYVVIIEDFTKGATLAKTEHKVKTGIPFLHNLSSALTTNQTLETGPCAHCREKQNQ